MASNIANQFTGLPIENLIAAPLQAAAEGQKSLAATTAQFITEVGETNNKSVVAEVESVLVNSIKETPVRGYEIFAQDVTQTSHGYYRAYVGLRLPMGELNKMYNYTVEEAVNAYVSKKTGSPATSSWEELMMNEDEDNSIQ